MSAIQLTCFYCKKEFSRGLNRVNENRKFGYNKFYCSLKCLGNSRKNRKILTCENKECKKKFERTLAETSIHNFCSKSCAVKFSNKNKQRKIKICSNPNCKRKLSGYRKYCSSNCIPKTKSKYTKELIVAAIKEFGVKNNRIPTKRDLMEFYRMARRIFKTWNNAVLAAGYEPNPVRFAKKYIAKDGHKCDSLAEKIIDDWLYSRKITHERNYQYGVNRMTADFKVKDFLIEFLGLKGQLKSYDRLIGIKKKLWKERKLKVIEIYPEDLFPNNKLNKILKIFINNN